MSKLIIICGLAGTGKSTLARELSKRLNICCLHKDTIKAGLYEKLNFHTEDSYKLYFHLAEDQVKNNVDLIMESPFIFEGDRKILKKWQKKYKIDLTCIICSADVETRKKRILTRERHDCHREADKKLLKNLTPKDVDYSKLPGRKIEIITDKPVEKLVENIIKKLNDNEYGTKY
ncbi:ATP-binding protein [Patescibacteria group bacterium]|nr:ATP-binding protein [Patescibacteria group bacterium]MBU1721794.1 ATP-binding protein [Patescibacteria group bacterium]